MQDNHLGITLTTVTRARLFAWLAALHDNDVRNDVTGDFVQPGEDLAHVVLLGTLAEG